MIDQALKFLADAANGYMSRRLGLSLGKLSVGPLVDLGTGALALEVDSTRLALFQIEEERVLREQMPLRQVVAGREVTLPPPIKVNLIVVVTGRFQSYDEGLRRLACLLTFFQANPVFTPGDHPAMPTGVERLSVELLSYGPDQLNQLWTCIGTKHMPAMVYRIRMLWLQDTEPKGTGSPVSELATQVNGL
ncbi:MAG: hypothetical protein RI907_1168 [Pseudomonadota bacterium]|jgi:hypothetical protein